MRYISNASVNDFNNLFNALWDGYGAKIPPVDVTETENAYYIAAELPGFEEKDVDVNVEKHVLKISSVRNESEKKEENEEQKAYLIRERSRMTFERSFSLPEGCDEEKIAGTFKNGILTIEIPKLPAVQPKKIAVKIN